MRWVVDTKYYAENRQKVIYRSEIVEARDAFDAAEEALSHASVYAHRMGVVATAYPVWPHWWSQFHSRYEHPNASFHLMGNRKTTRLKR